MKRKKTLIFLSIIILIIAGFIIRKKVKKYQAKWESIDQTYMADFTGNGKKELLIIYNLFENESAMKLIDVEKGKTIWKSTTHPSFIHEVQRITVQDSVLAIAYHDYVNKPDSGYCELGVEGFSSITGEKLWDYRFKDDDRYLGLYFWLVGYKNQIIIQTEKSGRKNFITSIDLKKGEFKWEDTLNCTATWAPHFINNKMILGKPREFSIIDLESGEITNNINSGRYSRLITTDSTIFFFANDTIFVCDSVSHPLFFNDKPITLISSDSGYVELVAHSNGSFVSINKTSYDSTLHYEISSTPYKKGKKKYSYCFGDSMQIQHWFNHEALARNPVVSPFHNISTKFIPLIVQKEINADSCWKHIAIFDIEQGKPLWLSKAYKFRDIEFLGRDILYYNGFFIIGFNLTTLYDHKADHAFLVLDGNKGLFSKCVNIYSEEVAFSISNWDNYKMFSGDYFYGSYYDVAWVLSYPDLEFVYLTNKKLKSRDCKERLEQMFGKMPWENNN